MQANKQKVEFSPSNPVVRLCLKGMEMEEKRETSEARNFFLQAWNEAREDFEKFLAAHFLGRNAENVPEKLKWFERSLEIASGINDYTVRSALPSLYSAIAECYRELAEPDKAKKNKELAGMYRYELADTGPFYHGTKAELALGALLTAGRQSNYQEGLMMNHIYFSASVSAAALAAALAKGEGAEQIYMVEPTGKFENDPNVTDKKFPGNPTRSYRTDAPLKIIGKLTDWVRPSPELLQRFRQRLEENNGGIIN